MATRTWTGAVSNQGLGEPGNWVDNIEPVDGDDIYVPDGVAAEIDLYSATPITFGTFTSELSFNCSIGNNITFSGLVSAVALSISTGATFNGGIEGAITAPAPGGGASPDPAEVLIAIAGRVRVSTVNVRLAAPSGDTDNEFATEFLEAVEDAGGLAAWMMVATE